MSSPAECPTDEPIQTGIAEMLRASAERSPDAIAIAAPGRSPLTYGQLHRQVESVVASLNARGVGRNDRVAIVLPNGPEMAVAFLGVAAGATGAPLNPAYRAEEFDFYLSDLGAKALIVQSDMDSPAVDVARARSIPSIQLSPDTDAEAGLFSLTGGADSPTSAGGLARPHDVALVLHTSGTTSRPKVVPLTQANLCASAANVRMALDLTAADRCLNVMPLFHVHGLVAALLASLSAQGTVICAPGFYAPQFFPWLDQLRPTWYTAVPTMHQSILARAPRHREIIARRPLRLVRSSSSALPPQVLVELEEVFGAPVIEAYGMTEAAHQMASNPLPPRPRKRGSVGLAAGPDLTIMDDAGRLLPRGQPGEIVIRGANVMGGYENNPGANQATFTHGWLRTGDQGYLDDDGYLYITGRLKEIINRGGEKISPREVDEVLLDHPAVAQAVTFGIPSGTLGEEVGAVVVLRQGQAATERNIRDFAATRLADFKVPCMVLIQDELLKGPTGKVQRIGLAERLGVLLPLRSETSPVREYTAPQTPVEEIIAGIWSEVLGERAGIHDHFLDLGGDSILAIQLVARVRETLRLELSLRSLFDAPTIREQAAIVEELLQ